MTTPPPSDMGATPDTMPVPELLELYQQISHRGALYNTEILIERMFELRGILARRFANIEAERDRLQVELGVARKERDALAKIYRRDYGHDFNPNDKYEGI